MATIKDLERILEKSKEFYEKRGYFPTVLIIGRSGIGKSYTVRKFAEKNRWELIDIRLINYMIGDLVTKVPVEEEKKLKNMFNEWIHKITSTEKPIILFLDEIDKAEPSVQRMIYQIIQDKRIEEMKISPHVFIISAQNTEEDGEFFDIRREKPLWDKFTFRIKVDFDEKEFLKWASENLHPYVYTFLDRNRDMIYIEKNEVLLTTPRRWEYVSEIIETVGFDKSLLVGLLGDEIGNAFYEIKKIEEKYKNYIDNPYDKDFSKIPVDDLIMLFVPVFKKIYEDLKKNKNKDKIKKFFERLNEKYDDEMLIVILKIMKSVGKERFIEKVIYDIVEKKTRKRLEEIINKVVDLLY